MNDRNIRRFERATRVQTFGRDHAADFAPGGKAAVLFEELGSLVTSLTAARVGQLRGPAGKEAVIDALSEDFKDIARTSRAIALDEPCGGRSPSRPSPAPPAPSRWMNRAFPSPPIATPPPLWKRR